MYAVMNDILMLVLLVLVALSIHRIDKNISQLLVITDAARPDVYDATAARDFRHSVETGLSEIENTLRDISENSRLSIQGQDDTRTLIKESMTSAVAIEAAIFSTDASDHLQTIARAILDQTYKVAEIHKELSTWHQEAQSNFDFTMREVVSLLSTANESFSRLRLDLLPPSPADDDL